MRRALGVSSGWWITGLAALVLSQVLIVSFRGDAMLGVIVTLVLLVAVAYGFATYGPWSLRAEYRREVARRLERSASPAPLDPGDLGELPEPVRRYLHATHAVGLPGIHHVEARWRGRIRATANDPWMPFTAEQLLFPGEPSRFFLMHARRGVLPVEVLHVYRGGSASMRVRILSLLPIVDASGPELDRAETVTMLNDLALLAPAALIDPAIRWERIEETTARARYTVGTTTVGATLEFDDSGELTNFVSDDRLAISSDGETFTRRRWSTPVEAYRRFGERRCFTRGEGRWHPPEGAFTYLELELTELRTNAGIEPGGADRAHPADRASGSDEVGGRSFKA
jgi:hypothetical protein